MRRDTIVGRLFHRVEVLESAMRDIEREKESIEGARQIARAALQGRYVLLDQNAPTMVAGTQ